MHAPLVAYLINPALAWLAPLPGSQMLALSPVTPLRNYFGYSDRSIAQKNKPKSLWITYRRTWTVSRNNVVLFPNTCRLE
ncbi:MAG: hypothetical protein U0Z17_08355 [Bacteroidales bacterium]